MEKIWQSQTIRLIQEGQEAHRKLDRSLRQNFGVTYAQYEILKTLTENAGSIPIGQIADTLGCTRGNMTIICDHLERDGWILRERSKDDRRVVHVRIVKDFAPVDAWVQSQN